jgi:ketose-bisphosphate aldolase
MGGARLPVVTTKEILDRAFAERYGVAAINVINDLTMEAVLAAAEELRAPVILATSVKHVKMTGIDAMYAMWVAYASRVSVPVVLHLDHCPERDVISACLAKGWNSVLFDASKLTVEENKRQCIEVVAEARRYGAHVEGEIEGFKRTEEMTGHEAEEVQSLETVVDFVRSTGVDVFAPAIGNAHGTYKTAPHLDSQRVTDIVKATGVPVALHGGTGMSPEQFSDLISRGCAKVNISTALKIAYMKSGFDFMTEHPGEYDPPSIMKAQRTAVMEMAKYHMRLFGSEGKAWT